MSKIKGLHTHRFRDNPEERRFAEKWASQDPCVSDDIVYGKRSIRGASVVVREQYHGVVARTIQWLGSPVGQGFLRGLGYQRVEKTAPAQKTRTLTPDSDESPCCGKALAWAQIYGLRVYKVVRGRVVYTAKCSACGKSFSVKGGVAE